MKLQQLQIIERGGEWMKVGGSDPSLMAMVGVRSLELVSIKNMIRDLFQCATLTAVFLLLF